MTRDLKGGTEESSLSSFSAGVKAKSKCATSSNNPAWDDTITLTPVESLDLDLRVQIYDKHVFHADVQAHGTLKIPLAQLLENQTRDEWFLMPQGDDDAQHPADKQPAIKLKLTLVGVKSA